MARLSIDPRRLAAAAELAHDACGTTMPHLKLVRLEQTRHVATLTAADGEIHLSTVLGGTSDQGSVAVDRKDLRRLAKALRGASEVRLDVEGAWLCVCMGRAFGASSAATPRSR